MVDLTDEELLRQLETRDGPLGERYRPHTTGSQCRYAAHYAEKNRVCPWCEAAERRGSPSRGPGV
jgi:hypothetical protein